MSDRKGHESNEMIAELLERCRCLWQKKVDGIGLINAYSTPAGLIVFIDHERGGWTMLSECPSNAIADNAIELSAMVHGQVQLRAKAGALDIGGNG